MGGCDDVLHRKEDVRYYIHEEGTCGVGGLMIQECSSNSSKKLAMQCREPG